MGLDMYLYAEKYMGNDETASYAEIKNLAGLKDLPTPDFSNVIVKITIATRICKIAIYYLIAVAMKTTPKVFSI